MAAADFRVGPVSWPRSPRDEDARDDGADVDLVGRKRKRAELPAGPAPKRRRVAAAADLASSPASSEPSPASPPPVKCELRPQSVEPPPVVPVAATAPSTMEVKVKEENVKVEEGDVKAEEEDVKIEEVEDRAPRARRGRKQGPSRDRRSCHQCKRVKPRPEEMIRCLRCDLRIYCATCVRNRYPSLSEAEAREACPFCRGVCICTLCDKQAKSKSSALRKCNGRTSVTRQKKPSATGVKSPRAHNVARRTKAIEHSFAMANRVNNASAGSDGVDTSNVRAVEVDAETKSKYASYLLHYLLPCLIQINKDQMEELEAEARMQGLELSVSWNDERVICDNCSTSIFDLHRSCPNPNCSYELCIVCCKELREGLKGTCQELVPDPKSRGLDYMHGGEPEPDKVIDNDKTGLSSYQSKSIKWDADPQGNIYCPASELDGRDSHILKLRRFLPKDWLSKLEMDALQISKQLDTSDIVRTDTYECSCSNNHESSRKAASRENQWTTTYTVQYQITESQTSSSTSRGTGLKESL